MLPELVYTMFVPLTRPIERVNEARMVRLLIQAKGERGPDNLELPSAGYQKVEKLKKRWPCAIAAVWQLLRVRALCASPREHLTPAATASQLAEPPPQLQHATKALKPVRRSRW